MYKTEIKLSSEQQDFIKTAMKGNFHKMQFIKNINYQEISPPFIRTCLRRLIGLINYKQRGLIRNFTLTNSIDASINKKKIYGQIKRNVLLFLLMILILLLDRAILKIILKLKKN